MPKKQNVAYREIKHNVAKWPLYALRHNSCAVSRFLSAGSTITCPLSFVKADAVLSAVKHKVAEREKIDFIFVTPQIKVADAEIISSAITDSTYLSDHNAHLADLEF